MRPFLQLLFLLSILLVRSAFGCDNNIFIRHINADGSVGGLVNANAHVDPAAYIGKDAKVCDFVWVEANSTISGTAIVRDRAWIRSFSLLSDSSTVSDNAIVQGREGSSTIVSGSAKIFENAKLFDGSKINGDSQIFGNSILRSSTTTGHASVCESYVLENVTISDDYYCQPADSNSQGSLSFLNYSQEKVNPRNSTLKIKIDDARFNLDSSVYQIFINDVLISSENLEISATRLYVKNVNLVEGVNKITVIGKDHNNKKIVSSNNEFLVGSQLLEIPLSGKQGDIVDVKNLLVTMSYQNLNLTCNAKVVQGNLRVYGLPIGLSYKLFVQASSPSEFLIAEFSSENLPPLIQMQEIPPFAGNDLSLSSFSTSWSINNPGAIDIINTGKRVRVKIDPNLENIIMRKRIRFAASEQGLSFKFEVPYGVTAKLSYFSTAFPKFEAFDLSVNPEVTFTKSRLNQEDEMVVILEVSKSSNDVDDDYVYLDDITLPHKMVTFEPMNFFPLNKLDSSSIPPTSTQLCDDERFRGVSSNNLIPLFDRKLEFLSLGSSGIPGVEENRIWGKLVFWGVTKRELESINLIISQGTKILSPIGLAKCAKQKFDNWSDERPALFEVESSLLGYLFAIPLGENSNFNGTSINLQVQGKLHNNEEPLKSNIVKLKILKAVTGFPSFGSLETYDYSRVNRNRFGGDKWIRPFYVSTMSGILAVSGWQINDLTKLNGGGLDPHSTHDAGFDADVAFPPIGNLMHDFRSFGFSSLYWDIGLEKIDNFLDSILTYQRYIRDIYLSVRPNSGQLEYDSKFLKIRYENTCYKSTRYIQFGANNGESSFLIDRPSHVDHMHIRFNYSESSATPTGVEPRPTNLKLSDLWYEMQRFKIGEEYIYTLLMFPKDFAKFNGKKILWRLQDREGFTDFNMNITYGSWFDSGNKSQMSEQFGKFSSKVSPKIFYVTIANKSDGGCIQYAREIEVPSEWEKEYKKLKWTYEYDNYKKLKIKIIERI